MKFAAFIITYERTGVVLDTIDKLQSQTLPPSKILVVDNSESADTETAIATLNHETVEYHRVGYNLGPAGAAKIGLEKLTAEGFDWIFWGDDDDPPHFEDACERLFETIKNNSHLKIGVVAAVGHYFNRRTGVIKRVKDEELNGEGALSIQNTAGGQTMIVNSAVVKEGVLPDENLFFGFEELDFCLNVENKGYKLLVPKDLFIMSRTKTNRLNASRPLISTPPNNRARVYYSTRNLLIILRKQGLFTALIWNLIKLCAKCILAFRYGIGPGRLLLKMYLTGLLHGFGVKHSPLNYQNRPHKLSS